MNITNTGTYSIVEIEKNNKIHTVQDALDIMANASYITGNQNIGIIVHEGSLKEDFFKLSTGFAGELLQKFSNYNVKLAIVGDFSKYKSKALADFIRECNRGSLVFFNGNVKEAYAKILN